MEPTSEPQPSSSPRKKAWAKSDVLQGIKEATVTIHFYPVFPGGLGKVAEILRPKLCALSPGFTGTLLGFVMPQGLYVWSRSNDHLLTVQWVPWSLFSHYEETL